MHSSNRSASVKGYPRILFILFEVLVAGKNCAYAPFPDKPDDFLALGTIPTAILELADNADKFPVQWIMVQKQIDRFSPFLGRTKLGFKPPELFRANLARLVELTPQRS